MFVQGKPFEPSLLLMFMGEARSLP